MECYLAQANLGPNNNNNNENNILQSPNCSCLYLKDLGKQIILILHLTPACDISAHLTSKAKTLSSLHRPGSPGASVSVVGIDFFCKRKEESSLLVTHSFAL